MEQAEKALRDKVFLTSKSKTLINRILQSNEFREYNQTSKFNQNLKNYNKDTKEEIINQYIHPTKEALYELDDDIYNQLEEDADTSETLLNKKFLEVMAIYLKFSEEKSKLNKILRKEYEEAYELRNKIKEGKETIKKNEEEANEYARKIEEKKKKEKDERGKIIDQIDLINHEKGKIEVENYNIQHELDENRRIFIKKEEELQKVKQSNYNLEQEIKYYKEAIKYQNQLHNDIQVYKNQMNNEYQEAKGNVRVFCRIRPPLQREISKKQIDIEYRGDNSLIIKGEKKASNIGREGGHQDLEQFQFNRIFKQNDTQEEVFEEVSPLIQSSLDGFNINIFAYGQTGSGKTFTMEGDMSSPEKYGIVPRSVDRIFKYYDEELKNMGWEIKFSLSVCEIYNKKTRDLLGEKNVDKTEELKEMEIHNLKEWNSNFGQIAQRRKVAETKMNMESSRSHLIFKIKIHLHNKNGTENDRFGSLNLIDLAGSERVDKATVSEERFKESIEINSSLTHLKSVFEAMKSKHDKFVPFHNTPLTDVLKDCLSGDNSKTLMFVNISPLLESFKESTCSLKFATDVNKCYVSSNDDNDEEDDFDGIDKNYEPMELDI